MKGTLPFIIALLSSYLSWSETRKGIVLLTYAPSHEPIDGLNDQLVEVSRTERVS